ncbi:uncharacterized protein LOC117339622 [Pecten maximus]|uniref:uncharacterized protein LOC117339622 n=1 Tax=Pecten maximus TaxID=6579 RepID=UPI00145886C5|nr:uncharacterized protein LOC117339622 [Pecten maximus]
MDIRNEMYNQHTVTELDKWMIENNLSSSTDTELSLRRIALLTDQSTVQQPAKTNKCVECNKVFKQKSHLLRHERTFHGDSIKYTCAQCSVVFNRKDNFKRHLKMHKENTPPNRKRKADETCNNIQSKFPKSRDIGENRDQEKADSKTAENEGKCIWCSRVRSLLPGKKFCKTCGDQGRECNWCHRPLPERFYGKRTDVCDGCLTRRDTWNTRQQRGGGIEALEGTARLETLDPNPGNLWDILQFFNDNQTQIKDILEERLKDIKGMKWFLTLFVKFVKYDQNNEPIYAEPTFRSINLTCTNVSKLTEQLAEAFQNLHNAYQNFERDGSGWTIDKILKLEVNTVEYTPLEGSSYIPLPQNIQKKKAVLNIKT